MAIDLNWIMGIAIMFGLAIILTYATFKDIDTFFIFLTVFSGFVVWSGLLPLWVLVINIIILTLMMINTLKKIGVK